MKKEGYKLKLDEKKFYERMLPEERIRQRDVLAVTDAEVYAVNVMQQELQKAKVDAGTKQVIIERTKQLLIYHRQEVRDMYRTSKMLLKSWVLEESGVKDAVAFMRMKEIGMTGDIMHDMELLGMAAGRRRG